MFRMTEINLKQVSLSLAGKPVLNAIDLSVEKGQWITLTGPSGSGKSTILKLIANLINPDSGIIFFQEKNIQELDPINYRRQVSYAVQSAQLFGKTVKDNLDFPYLIRKKAIDEKHEKSLLTAFDLPEDFLYKSVLDISGGQRQRVALARNFVFPPQALLLDEVTTGLDELTKKIVRQVIEENNHRGLTVIEVTHEAEDLSEAKKIYIVDKGRIQQETAHE